VVISKNNDGTPHLMMRCTVVVPGESSIEFFFMTTNVQEKMKRGKAFRDAFNSGSPNANWNLVFKESDCLELKDMDASDEFRSSSDKASQHSVHPTGGVARFRAVYLVEVGSGKWRCLVPPPAGNAHRWRSIIKK